MRMKTVTDSYQTKEVRKMAIITANVYPKTALLTVASSGVPLILFNHWGAVLDNFDPRIVGGLATISTGEPS